MAEPLRHRQTKEAATDMFYLKPPRHISTLPKNGSRGLAAGCLLRARLADMADQRLHVLCQKRSSCGGSRHFHSITSAALANKV